MKVDHRIIKYFENELNQQEKNSFESELNTSEELRNEYQKYLKIKMETTELKNLKLNADYLNSIIPEFKARSDSPEQFSYKRNLGYAFGFMAMIFALTLVMRNFFTDPNELSDLQQFTQSLNDSQKIALLENLNGDLEFYDFVEESKLNNFLALNLQIDNETAEAYNIQYNDLVEGLSSKEIDIIYNKILNSNF